jgi:phosphate starvation-inducible protein PhoH
LSRQRANKKQQSQRFNDNVINFQEYQPKKKTQVKIIPRNRSQESYFLKLQDPTKTMIFAVGPAGTGKTLLATQTAIKLLRDGAIDKVIITRPAVSVMNNMDSYLEHLKRKWNHGHALYLMCSQNTIMPKKFKICY